MQTRGVKLIASACAVCIATMATAGPDVLYTEISSVTHYAPVGSVHAYAIGSHTCNVGDQNMIWNGGTGSPWLAMNMYRLHDGRLVQIGMSWCKNACCAAAQSGCPNLACNGVGGQQLGVGCRDVYGSSYNGGQARLGPRSGINAYSGQISENNSSVGDSIYKRLQVIEDEMSASNYPGALYFLEGQYIAVDETPGGDAHNNASYRPATVNTTTFDVGVTGATQAALPAIYAWRDHGNGLNSPDASVKLSNMDVPGEGRFVAARKVIDNGDGTWRYEYAVYNINSDRSGGSFAVRVPIGAEVTNIGFRDVRYHSGEERVYDQSDWRSVRVGDRLIWNSPQPYSANANSNALRWGTMYNFWFSADRPPVLADTSLGLFKPGTPERIDGTAEAPGGCAADVNSDDVVDVFDLLAYLDIWFDGSQVAELTDDFPPLVDVFDLLQFLDVWFAEAGGCA